MLKKQEIHLEEPACADPVIKLNCAKKPPSGVPGSGTINPVKESASVALEVPEHMNFQGSDEPGISSIGIFGITAGRIKHWKQFRVRASLSAGPGRITVCQAALREESIRYRRGSSARMLKEKTE